MAKAKTVSNPRAHYTLTLAMAAFVSFLIILGFFKLAEERRERQFAGVPENQIVALVDDHLPQNNDLGVGFTRQQAVVKTDGGYHVVVDFNADAAESTVLRRILIEQKMGELYRALYESHHDIALVTISAYYPLERESGGTYDAVVYKTSLSRQVAGAIDFEKPDSVVELVLIPTVWQVESIHPNFSRDPS